MVQLVVGRLHVPVVRPALCHPVRRCSVVRVPGHPAERRGMDHRDEVLAASRAARRNPEAGRQKDLRRQRSYQEVGISSLPKSYTKLPARALQHHHRRA